MTTEQQQAANIVSQGFVGLAANYMATVPQLNSVAVILDWKDESLNKSQPVIWIGPGGLPAGNQPGQVISALSQTLRLMRYQLSLIEGQVDMARQLDARLVSQRPQESPAQEEAGEGYQSDT